MDNLLQEAFEQNNPVSIYGDPYDSTVFSFGTVMHLSAEHLLFASIDPDGFNDGWQLIKLDDIYRIETDGAYENKIIKLHKLRAEPEQEPLPVDPNDLLRTICAYAAQNRILCSFRIAYDEGDTVSGFITEISDEEILIQAVSTFGMPNGLCRLKMDSIKRIGANTSYQDSLMLLYQDYIRSQT